MKGKKSKKKGTSISESLNSSKNDSKYLEEPANSSFTNEVTNKFTVLVNTQHIYSKWIKSKNVALLHPSDLNSSHCPSHFIIKGKGNLSLCVAYPLKSVRRSTIVLPKKSMGFVHEEQVEFYSYTKPIYKAVEVTLKCTSKVFQDADLEQQLLSLLIGNYRYFYIGMTVILKHLQSATEFVIINISCKENETVIKTLEMDGSDFKTNNSISICNDSSLNSPIPSKLLFCSTFQESEILNPENSSLDLNSIFSTMSLNESKIEDSKSFKHDKSVTSAPEINWNVDCLTFFTAYHGTSINILMNTERNIVQKTYFSSIGGLKLELESIKVFIDMILNPEKNHKALSLASLLLSGPSGSGKSLVLDAICNEYNIHFEEILWYRLYAKRPLIDTQHELHRTLQNAIERAPCFILLDDFNYLCPAKHSPQTRFISAMLSNFINTYVGNPIIILATTNSSDYNSEVLAAGNALMEEIKFPIPSSMDREDILVKLLNDTQHTLSTEEVKQCAALAQGFTGKDLNSALNEALNFQLQKDEFSSSGVFSEGRLTFVNIVQSIKLKRPSIVKSDIKIKKVKWCDIGGMSNVKEKLKDIVEGPIKYPEIYKKYDVTPSRGILLYGPPGCSKTMIAKALATECNLNFISKNVSDIHNKYVGESEKAVRDLFIIARARAPCIIFLDEIDALAPGRGSSCGSGVEERIVNTFLQEMDGLEELCNVIVVAATNRPDRLDEAFVRNGRINHFIYIPLPDIEAREEILKLQMKNRFVGEDIDYRDLAFKTEGYSGAEIVNICNEAAFQVLTEDVENKSFVFTLRHFEAALTAVIPRTSKEMLSFYEEFNARFCIK